NDFFDKDSTSPHEVRENARKDVLKYDNVALTHARVTDIDKDGEDFTVYTESDEYKRRQVLLATGLKEETPDIPNFDEFYGTSAFYCPWCDGYELRGRRLAVMADEDSTRNLVMLISNWSDDLLICTDGKSLLKDENKQMLKDKGFEYNEAPIFRMSGNDSKLESIEFEDGTTEAVEGMFVKMNWDTDFPFLETLDPDREEDGGLRTNPAGETSVKGLFAAGETKTGVSSQLINAAASGADIAKTMMIKLMKEEF